MLLKKKKKKGFIISYKCYKKNIDKILSLSLRWRKKTQMYLVIRFVNV